MDWNWNNRRDAEGKEINDESFSTDTSGVRIFIGIYLSSPARSRALILFKKQ
jgi:hypothetical protein